MIAKKAQTIFVVIPAVALCVKFVDITKMRNGLENRLTNELAHTDLGVDFF